MAMAQTLERKVEAAYNRGDLLERRRALMEDWSAFLGTFEREVVFRVMPPLEPAWVPALLPCFTSLRCITSQGVH